MKKLSILLLLLLLGLGGYCQTPGQPLGDGPRAATLAAGTQASASLFTGQAIVNIPVYTVSHDNISVPVALNYNSGGVKPDEHPGWVGLNWNLQAGGVITRKVNDLPDDCDWDFQTNSLDKIQYGYYWKRTILNNHLNGNVDFDANEKFDTEPDEFIFNVNGLTGKFFLQENGSWIVQGTKTFRVEFNDSFLNTPMGYGSKFSRAPATFAGFTIITDDGTKYKFGGANSAIQYSIPIFYNRELPFTADTWYLTEIETTDGNKVNLSYSEDAANPFTAAMSQSVEYVKKADPQEEKNWFDERGYYQGLLIRPVHLRQIDTPSERVVFQTSQSVELRWPNHVFPVIAADHEKRKPVVNFLNQANYDISKAVTENGSLTYIIDPYKFQWQKLDKIFVFSKANLPANIGEYQAKSVREYGFAYNNDPQKRLMLQSVSQARDDRQIKTAFTYYHDNAVVLPDYCDENGKLDHWGHYNGRSLNLKSKVNGILNSGQMEAAKRVLFKYLFETEYKESRASGEILNLALEGSLQSVIYPTGGQTLFTYEQHTYSKQLGLDNTVSSLPAPSISGGLRIRKIEEKDGETLISRREYDYMNSGTQTSVPVYYHPLFGNDMDNQAGLYSLFVTNYNPYSNPAITYENVKESSPNTGYSQFLFQTFKANGDVPSDEFPAGNNWGTPRYTYRTPPMFFPMSNREFMRGQLLRKDVYNQAGKLLSTQKYTYNTTPLPDLGSFSRSLRMVYDTRWAGFPMSGIDARYKYYYKLFSHTYGPTLEENYTYDPNTPVADNSRFVYTKTEYSYNQLSQVEVTKTTYPDGKIIAERSRYPIDYHPVQPNHVIGQMVIRNMVGIPIEYQTHRVDKNPIMVLGGRLNIFVDNPQQGGIKLSESYEMKTNADLSGALSYLDGLNFIYDDRYKNQPPVIKHHQYTPQGKPYIFTTADGLTSKTTYFADNSVSAGSVAGAVASKNVIGNFNPANPTSHTDYQQTKTSFKYQPGVGVKEVTDARGRKTAYNYDEMGRLIDVRDHSNNYLKSYAYNYRTSPIVAPVIGSFVQTELCPIDNSCTPPAAPTVGKTSGTTVCVSPAQQVTLTANAGGGIISWYRDGVLIQDATALTYTTNLPGMYSAKVTSGGCASAMSKAVLVKQTAGCFADDNCIVTKVKLLWRTSDKDRLIGATIQGSDDGTQWTTIHTFRGEATGSWEEFPIANSRKFQHIRYAATEETGVGDLREIWFFNGNTLLTGTAFGSEPNIAGLGWPNAMDGDENSVWHAEYRPPLAHLGSSNFVGLTLPCATSLITPTLYRIAGSTVCTNGNQAVTLKVSGYSGSVKWYRDGVLVADSTRLELVVKEAGKYTARSSSGTGLSNYSNEIIVQQTPDCVPVDVKKCVVDRVRFLWRTSNLERLAGATIQGSPDGVTWNVLYTFPANAVASRGWDDVTFGNTTPYQHVRYVATSNNGVGDLREILFYSGGIQLTGKGFGSEPNISGMEWIKALDGDESTAWHAQYQGIGAHVGNTNFVGISLSCATSCITPVVYRTAGNAVCPNGSESVRLTASGYSDSLRIQWYKGDALIPGANKVNYETKLPGSYKARSSAATGCLSAYSNAVAIQQSSTCVTVDNCVANKVRLMHRNTNLTHLKGSKIQGSNNGIDWELIGAIDTVATGGWQEFGFNNTNAYHHVRFAAGQSSYGELVEMEFYNGASKLVGTAFGSEPNVGPTLKWQYAVDGSTATSWHGKFEGTGAHAGESNFVGLTLKGCGSTCITPVISVISGSKVCPSGTTVTLTASGFTGRINWYKDGKLLEGDTLVTYQANSAGRYSARSSAANCTSAFSNEIVLEQDANCFPLNNDKCIVNKVRLLWRANDLGRLNGATIQGSDDGRTWNVIYEFQGSAKQDEWNEFELKEQTRAYQHIRYAATPNSGVGDLREIVFYHDNYVLTGTVFGSEPNLPNQGWTNALDGNVNTQWHAQYLLPSGHPGSSNFVGISLPCATTLITPVLYKSTNGDVCPSGESVLLTASGFSGGLEWYRDGVKLTTGASDTTYLAKIAGTYTVRSKSVSSYSGFSNSIVLKQSSGCVPPAGNQCTANMVKLMWRNADEGRLNGATIQGSSNGLTWETLYTFTGSATQGWMQATFNNPNKYPHIRYNASNPNGVGDLREIRFCYKDGSNNEYMLSGKGFGSEPNIKGLEWQNALDGEENTQWHAEYVPPRGHPGNSNFVGISLSCATTCITPTLYKMTDGNLVCPGSKSATLVASGYTGTISWYRDGVLLPNVKDTILTVSAAGSYKAMSSNGICSSGFSNAIVLQQDANCAPAGDNRCIVTSVKLLWRAANQERLNGAMIQGSNDGASWETIHTFNGAAINDWNVATISNPRKFDHIRYVARANDGVGDLREIRFYNGEFILKGAGFGSEPNLPNQDWTNALDGNENTQWHAEYLAPAGHPGNTNFVGLTLPCATTLITPALHKMAGNTVCTNGGATVKLTASGFSGTLQWFRDGILIANASDTILIATEAGKYAVRSSLGSAFSNYSNEIVVEQIPGCVPINGKKCVVDRVRFLWRTSNRERLAAATIQGSADGVTWNILHTFPGNAVASLGWDDVAFGNTTEYQHVRYVATNGTGVGDLREIRFYSGGIQLAGTSFGSEPNIPGMEWQKALDGDESTAWHAKFEGLGSHVGNTNFVGLTLSCATTSITPAIYKIAGSDVCVNGTDSVTLVVSGSTGTVSWFKDSESNPVGTGLKFRTNVPGAYKARSMTGSILSQYSNVITVQQASDCVTPDNCIVNKVRILWRASDLGRLDGSKIQGSNDGKIWTTISTLTGSATGSDWDTFTLNPTTAYNHIRYAATDNNGVGDLREIEFYNGTTRSRGVGFGSEPNILGMEWQKALDGNVNTQWHAAFNVQGAHPGSSNFVGLTLSGCGSSCITPTIYKTDGDKACPSGTTVTLTASGFTGNVSWYKDGKLIVGESNVTFVANSAGRYSARSSAANCTSAFSNEIVLEQDANCFPPNNDKCIVNKVRLLWRANDLGRLNGATIQGSDDGRTWNVIYEFQGSAKQDEWNEFELKEQTRAYQHIRYAATPNSGVGDLREIVFYHDNYVLTGTVFGSEPNLPNQGWTNALDGNVNTQWHAQYLLPSGHPGSSNFVGISLPCATTLITPVLYKSTNGDVCPSGESVLLTASGFSGGLEWYRDGVKLTTGASDTTYLAKIAGTYTVRSKSVSSYSGFSNSIVLKQSSGCVPPAGNQCTANMVKLMWRNADEGRLNGATIQGSSNGLTWETLYTFTGSATQGWMQATFNNPNKYPHIRYNASNPNGVGDLREIRFCYKDGSNNEYMLSGKGFGSEPNIKGLEWQNALDGEENTQWHAEYVPPRGHPGNSNFVGISLSCATTCITPTLYKMTDGNLVCPGSKSATLVASGYTGTISWYRDGVLLPNVKDTILTVSAAGSYKAMSSNGICSSGFSNAIVLQQDANCAPAGDNRCIVTSVKLLWRAANQERLNGAMIQGSNDGASWETIHTFNGAAINDWNVATISNPRKFDHIRYVARANDGVGDLREIRFYNGEFILKGAGFGSEPNLPNQDWTNALDGNENTQWHAEYLAPAGHPGNTNFVGLTLPCGVTCIKPTIYKIAGENACEQPNQVVTLIASGFTSGVNWYLNDQPVPVANGGTMMTNKAGSYTARSATASCLSSASNTIVVNGCLDQTPVTPTFSIWRRNSATGVKTWIRDLQHGDQISLSDFQNEQVNWFISTNGQTSVPTEAGYFNKMKARLTTSDGNNHGWGPDQITDQGPYGIFGRDSGITPMVGTHELEATIWADSYQKGTRKIGFTIINNCTTPVVEMLDGPAACKGSKSVTLKVTSGCANSNDVQWFRNGAFFKNGAEVSTDEPGSYYAKCNSSCNERSNLLVVTPGTCELCSMAYVYPLRGDKDASIISFNPNLNYGLDRELIAKAWFDSRGRTTVIRSLFDFSELRSIPQGARVLYADLFLEGVLESEASQGPGNVRNGPIVDQQANSLYIQRITQPWDEYSVTWSNQPSVSTNYTVAIPPSTSQWDNYVQVKVTDMVQDMLNRPVSERHGFMIKLQKEVTQKSFMFSSRDALNSEKMPKLTVVVDYCPVN